MNHPRDWTHGTPGDLSIVWFRMWLVVKFTLRSALLVPHCTLSFKCRVRLLDIFETEDTVVGTEPSFEVAFQAAMGCAPEAPL